MPKIGKLVGKNVVDPVHRSESTFSVKPRRSWYGHNKWFFLTLRFECEMDEASDLISATTTYEEAVELAKKIYVERPKPWARVYDRSGLCPG